MAPLNPNNTPRYLAYYSLSGGLQHSLQVRAPAPVSPAAFGAFVDGFFTAFGSDLYAATLDFVVFIPSGTNIGNIVTTGFEGSTYGTGVQPLIQRPLQLTFVGRSPGGRRGRVSMFGWKNADQSWRYTAGEAGTIDAAIAVLAGAAGYPLGIDGTELVWKIYANIGYNDHYVKEARG